MSTTDHRPPTPAEAVASLDARRQRRRLEHLLDVRSRLALLAAERRSHRLDDADNTFGLQLTIEATLLEEFPDVHDERFSDWVAVDAANEHPPGVLSADCGICRSIATRGGINLSPPEAA